MGKTGRWFRSFLTSKKEKAKEKETENNKNSSPKVKKRWSFRRSIGAGKAQTTATTITNDNYNNTKKRFSECDFEQTKHAAAVAVATAAAADAAVAAAQAAAAFVTLRAMSSGGKTSGRVVEAFAAIKIQACFRSFLARKALCALKGLVKLQALIRGDLIRRQATETLRYMQALVAAQSHAQAKRIQMEEEAQIISQRPRTNYTRSPQHPRFQQSYEEENIQIVEMDLGLPRSSSRNRSSYSIPQSERIENRHSTYYSTAPSPSALTDISPRTRGNHFEEFSLATAQNSPHYYSVISDSTHGSIDYPFYPNYMANTQSSRAKARSQSAPKQRFESFERQPSRRRSVEGRNIPKSSVKMQRSSSQVRLCDDAYNQFPWHIKLDRSNVTVKDREFGSTCSLVTNGNYCRSVAGYEVRIC